MADLNNEPIEETSGQDGNAVYALAAAKNFLPGQGGLVFAGCGSGLLRSADGGQTWKDALEHLNLSEPVPVTSLAISPEFESDGVILAGSAGGVFRAASKQDFQVTMLPSPPPMVSSLAISPDFGKDDTVFAGTMEDGVFVSKNRGASWVAWNFGLLDLNVLCLAISPAFGTDETLFAGTETGIFRSTTGGRAWRETEMPFGFDAVISLAVSPWYSQDHVVYAGTESNGLWASFDGGDTWARLGAETITEPVNTIHLSVSQGALVSTGAALWHSKDGGKTWANCVTVPSDDLGISALLAPRGFGPGAQALAGFNDGSLAVLMLK